MGLVGIPGGEGDEEIDHLAGLRPAVAVVAEEDDEGGEEGGRVCGGLEVGPEVLELGEVAMDVTYADNKPRVGIFLLRYKFWGFFYLSSVCHWIGFGLGIYMYIYVSPFFTFFA